MSLKSCLYRFIGPVASVHPALRRARRRGLTTFVFHDIGQEPGSFAIEHHLCASPIVFQRQVEWITRHYCVIHPDDLLAGNKLPENAALITFDDGWAGTFGHGLPILATLGLPSVVFLNCAMLNGEPFAAAAAIYLGRQETFRKFADTHGIDPPYHLSLTPGHLSEFEAAHGLGWREGFKGYQGQFADHEILAQWDGRNDVRFGNHLYNHWNAAALKHAELEDLYLQNEVVLAGLSSARPLFAFPNGQSGLCFSEDDVGTVFAAGAKRIFAAEGRISIDPNALLLNRIALTDIHDCGGRLWYAVSWRSLAQFH
jgi:peptidoglycan/xylan/chitin deacetylase (PgdA/CDA1 family)